VPDRTKRVLPAARAIWATGWNVEQDAIKTECEGRSAARRETEKERAELAQEIGELETELDAAESKRAKLASTLAEEEKRHREAADEMGNLKIENASLEERVANTERRADELRAQVTRTEGELVRLAQVKGAPWEEPKEPAKPRQRPRPQGADLTGNTTKSKHGFDNEAPCNGSELCPFGDSGRPSASLWRSAVLLLLKLLQRLSAADRHLFLMLHQTGFDPTGAGFHLWTEALNIRPAMGPERPKLVFHL
jgi:septal ring factor EnvC (AmiA/AmiB activator)